ncbi:hypothetical protein ACFL1P_01645, partial [Patescibacteria group bacterium]
MAFKATSKKSAKQVTTNDQSVDSSQVNDSSSLSAEDLVGSSKVAKKAVEVPKKDVPAVKQEVPRSKPVTRRTAPIRPAESVRTPQRTVPSGVSSQRPSRGGDTRSGQRPVYRRNNRRDFRNGDNGGAYTQDINVPTETVRGVLDTMPEGHGFLRPKFTPSDKDVYISVSQIRRFMLRNGDMVEGQARAPKENERYFGLLKVEKVNEEPAENVETRKKFEDLVPVYPNKQIKLETKQEPLSTRIIDLVAPIGFGQRGLVVSPPKAGKTTILKQIAAGISENYPKVHLMAALIGERPEEVTDITRGVKGEVFASNFDESPGHQTRISEVALDRAKRL